MAKRALADVLWKAANEYLHSGLQDGESPYTCDALRSAGGWQVFEGSILPFLASIGFPLNGNNLYSLFDAFDKGDERQGVRYMWLLLAAHVAEDEGIEIEVS